jgi:hypothetical protein
LVVKTKVVDDMTKEEFSGILLEDTFERSGRIANEEFSVIQGNFEEYSTKYIAYLTENYNGVFAFDTLEEFLNGFIINGKPIGEQLHLIEKFSPILCND